MDNQLNYKESYQYIDVIKGLIIEHKLSQKSFAEIIGVNQTTVSQWLLGKKKPSYDCLLAICVNFNITPNELFGF